MMKTYIIAIFALFGGATMSYCHAQTKAIICIYNALSGTITDDENINNTLKKDRKKYEVIYNQKAYLCKKTYDKDEVQLEQDHLIDFIDLKDSTYTSQIFLNNHTDDRMASTTYLVTGRLKPFQWNITSETKNINGMQCFKATYTDKDFKYYSPQYVAWFTMEIPVSVGPMMQTNLPGMIVQLCTPTLIYTLESFNYSSDASIVKPTKGKSITEEQFKARIAAYDKN